MFCKYKLNPCPRLGSVLFTVTSTREVPPGNGEIFPWTKATAEPPPAIQAAMPSFVAMISSTLCSPALSHRDMNLDNVFTLDDDGMLIG